MLIEKCKTGEKWLRMNKGLLSRYRLMVNEVWGEVKWK
jgi:hypothetical protein